MLRIKAALAVAALMSCCSISSAQTPVGNGFTYQGKLTDGGAPATGQYDFTFRLHSTPDGIIPVGNLITLDNVQVTGGLFNVKLNFGAQFNGTARWLQISVRPGVSTGNFTALSPRQEITPAPYAISADNLQLPFNGLGESEADVLDLGLLTIRQISTGHAIKGVSQGEGAAIRGDATDEGRGVHGTSWNSVAGWFEISNSTNASTALFGRSNGAGHGVYAQNNGTGKALGAMQNGTSGEAGHFRVTGFGNQSASVRAETDNGGAAVYARSQFGPALQINRGHIKVDGAGAGADTPVFIHVVNSGNISDGQNRSATIIDHPLCNNDPNAILIITPSVHFGGPVAREPVAVLYGMVPGRWTIYNIGEEEMRVGLKFNIMVIKP